MNFISSAGSFFWPSWLKWTNTSDYLSILAETRLLNCVQSVKELFFVPVLDNKYFIRTLYAYKKSFSSEEEKTAYFNRNPILLVHGMGAGLALWCKNIDALADKRQVYAIDLMGFGNSSRPAFPRSAFKSENMFVQTIEDWRLYLGLDNLILLGHSLGGYICYSYGIQYGSVVTHIILVDPWGFRECKNGFKSQFRMNWAFSFLGFFFKILNPLFPLRLLGPLAPQFLRYFRQDLGITFHPSKVSLTLKSKSDNNRKGSDADNPSDSDATHQIQSFVLKQTESDLDAVFDYIYYCNTKYPSTGESAFKSMSSPIGWAAHPLMKRILDLDSHVDVTFVYGGKSWMDWHTGYMVQHLRVHSTVNVKVIDNAGHHVYAEACHDFNGYVNSVL